MADHSKEKGPPGAITPEGAIDSSWGRVEPLITAKKLKDLYLFGIPLISNIKDPLTNRAQILNDSLIEEKIEDAVSLAEAETGMQIFPTEIVERHAFDKNEFQALGYFQTRARPVSSIQRLSVQISNGDEVYVVPQEWIDTAYLPRGQIQIIPLNIATVGGSFAPAATSSGGGAFFLSILGQRPWIAAFWKIQLTAGWPDGKLPRLVNQLIGTIAAIEILDMLAATYARSTSHSLSIDAQSQSISTPGPQLFKTRIDELKEKRDSLVRKVKKFGGLLLVSNNV